MCYWNLFMSDVHFCILHIIRHIIQFQEFHHYLSQRHIVPTTTNYCSYSGKFILNWHWHAKNHWCISFLTSKLDLITASPIKLIYLLCRFRFPSLYRWFDICLTVWRTEFSDRLAHSIQIGSNKLNLGTVFFCLDRWIVNDFRAICIILGIYRYVVEDCEVFVVSASQFMLLVLEVRV